MTPEKCIVESCENIVQTSFWKKINGYRIAIGLCFDHRNIYNPKSEKRDS